MKNPFRLPSAGTFMRDVEGATYRFTLFGESDEVASASSEWWQEYRRRTKARYPVRYFLDDLWHVKCIILGRRLFRYPYWRFMHRWVPRYQYHKLDTGLKPGYYDPDTRFLHSIMEEVCRYVTITQGTIDWDYDDDHREKWRTLTEITGWWARYKHWDRGDNDPRWALLAEATEEQRDAIYAALSDDEERWDREADEHLIAIMKIRRTLWYP